MKFALFAATLLGMAMATPVAEAEMQGLEKRMPGCCSGATCVRPTPFFFFPTLCSSIFFIYI